MPITNELGQTRFGVRTTAIAPLLNTYSGATAAYSLRKLRSTYTGSAIMVRRSSDNAEQNIGFDSNGNLDTVALLSFVGSGNGFVKIWYDQSGNSNNATQTNNGNQPTIVSNGSVQMNGNKPAIYWDLGRTLVTNVNNIRSVFVNIKWITGSEGNNAILGHSSNAPYHTGISSESGWILSSSYSDSPIRNGSLYLNGNSKTLSTFLKNTDTNILVSMIHLSAAGYFNRIGTGHVIGTNFKGYYSEIITYSTDQSANRSMIESNMNSYYSIWDSDAEAFIAATNATGQAGPIRTLVASLKAAGLWSKLKAVYPFAGSTATSHKFNLKDPRDSDDAYRLNFYGGWTHYISGPYGNGGNTYADTNFNPFLKLSPNSSSIGVWVPNGMNNHGFGVWSNAGANKFSIIEQGGGYLKSQMTSTSTEAWGIQSTTSGFIMGSRTSATSNKIYRFGNLFPVHPTYGGVPYNTTQNTAAYPNANFWLGRVNGNTSISYYNNPIYFAYIADGLTDTEISALSSAAYTYRRSIGHY
jgi:hypothetical protein